MQTRHKHNHESIRISQKQCVSCSMSSKQHMDECTHTLARTCTTHKHERAFNRNEKPADIFFCVLWMFCSYALVSKLFIQLHHLHPNSTIDSNYCLQLRDAQHILRFAEWIETDSQMCNHCRVHVVAVSRRNLHLQCGICRFAERLFSHGAWSADCVCSMYPKKRGKNNRIREKFGDKKSLSSTKKKQHIFAKDQRYMRT